jgi:hypothetical protein
MSNGLEKVARRLYGKMNPAPALPSHRFRPPTCLTTSPPSRSRPRPRGSQGWSVFFYFPLLLIFLELQTGSLNQESISPTFYWRNCANILAQIKSLTSTASTKKLRAILSYEKGARRTLVKLTQEH